MLVKFVSGLALVGGVVLGAMGLLTGGSPAQAHATTVASAPNLVAIGTAVVTTSALERCVRNNGGEGIRDLCADAYGAAR